MQIVMIDMQMGNLRSLGNALQRVGAEPHIARSPRDVEGARAVVLPGVGSFADGMRSLDGQGLVAPLRRFAARDGVHLLGICLGMQLLAETGAEGAGGAATPGLGLVPGHVQRLRPAGGLRAPNIGWCDVTPDSPSALFEALHEPQCFYFAHGYHLLCPPDTARIATLDYGGPITAAVAHGPTFGVQFHPEKSQDAGFDLLERFVRHALREEVVPA